MTNAINRSINQSQIQKHFMKQYTVIQILCVLHVTGAC